MSEQAAIDEGGLHGAAEAAADSQGEERRPSGRIPGKRLVLFVALPIILLGMIGAGVYFSGLADPYLGKDGEGALNAEIEHGPSVYYELPEMLVNLNSSGRRAGYLKISVSLEVSSDKDMEQLREALPRIVDNFQVYLRELRVEDLRGSAGLQRLREELLLRVNTAVQTAEVRDVLFREMLVQ